MRLISAIILGLLFTSCTNTPHTDTTNTPSSVYIDTYKAMPPCIQYTPHTDNDPEGILFETWVAHRNLDYAHHIWTDTETGIPAGYSAAEDDAIYNHRWCF